MRQLGKKVNLHKVHPHKFRRTLATMAIDKGMPIEQVQKMLGHVKIDTTLHYAMVNQANVKWHIVNSLIKVYKLVILLDFEYLCITKQKQAEYETK